MNTAILESGVMNVFHPCQGVRSACNARCQIGCGQTDRRLGAPNLVILRQSVDVGRQSESPWRERIANRQFSGDRFAVTASRNARFDMLPSATGGIARLVTTRLREARIAPKPLLTQAGLTLAQIDNSETRVPVQSQIRLLELAAEALDDDLLGFRLACACEPR